MANFEPLLRGQCYSSNVNHCVHSSFDQRSLGPRNEVRSVNLAERLVGSEAGTFLFICNALTHWATLPKLGFSR